MRDDVEGTLARPLGHLQREGVVVSRINLSPKFMRELVEAMQDNYSKWSTREGIKNLPEFRDPPPGGSTPD